MKADRFWKGAARAAFDLAFPRRCPFCGAVIGWLPQCTDCKAKTDAVLHRPFSPPPSINWKIWKEPPAFSCIKTRPGGLFWK